MARAKKVTRATKVTRAAKTTTSRTPTRVAKAKARTTKVPSSTRRTTPGGYRSMTGR